VAERKQTCFTRWRNSSKRTVVGRRGQPEAVLDERLLAGAVALVLAVELGHGHVALVEHHQEVVGEVVEEGVRGHARASAVDGPRVVLDAVAHPHLAQHLEVVLGAHAEALGLEELALRLEVREALLELRLDAGDGLAQAVLVGDVVGGGEEGEVLDVAQVLAGDEVELGDAVDVVAEHLDADAELLVGGVDLDGVAPHPELAPAEDGVVALVPHVDQAAEDVALVVG
jgi:hypothetical protein